MKLVLCTHSGIAAWFLRFVMWSKYSHSAIFDGGVVTDSTFWQGGVKANSADAFFKKYTVCEFREIAIENERAARYWLMQQEGKPYDWTALLSWVVRRDWSKDDAWFCSELTETLIDKFSTPRFRAEAKRITPAHQAMVL